LSSSISIFSSESSSSFSSHFSDREKMLQTEASSTMPESSSSETPIFSAISRSVGSRPSSISSDLYALLSWWP
jgi:hypothetical protein